MSRLIATRRLLLVTTGVELPVGVLLLSSPLLAAWLILGASFDAPAAAVLGRIGGAAVLSLTVACWLARDDASSPGTRGLVAACCFITARPLRFSPVPR
jgi:hypothetical protein